MAEPQGKSYGDRVKTRREELGLKWREVAAIAGVAPATIHRANKNGAHTLQPSTRRGVEQALEWEPFSIDNIIAGGEPTAITTTETDESPATDREHDPVKRAMMMTREEMLDEAAKIDRISVTAADEWLRSILGLRMHGRGLYADELRTEEAGAGIDDNIYEITTSTQPQANGRKPNKRGRAA